MTWAAFTLAATVIVGVLVVYGYVAGGGPDDINPF